MTLATCLFTALTFTRTYGMYTIRDKKKNAINAKKRLLSHPTHSHAIL